MNKKGFTLMEILVVILIVAVLCSLFSLAHRKNAIIKTNERARALLVELANAAKLYNEMFPSNKIYGSFGDTPPASTVCPGCVDPCHLFRGSGVDEEVNSLIESFALVPTEWGISSAAACGNSLNYEGYKYIICNPYIGNSQPDDDCSNNRFAVMKSPTNMTYSKYSGKIAWITEDYDLGNKYE